MLDAILLNLLSQALWELTLSPLIDAAAKPEAGTAPFDEAVQEAVTALNETGMESGALRTLLQAPEVRDLVREMYVFEGTDPDRGLERVSDAFRQYWASRVSAPKDLADLVFSALARATGRVLEEAIAAGVLSAHEAKAAARQKALQDRLAAIDRKVEALGASRASLEIIDRFEGELRTEVRERSAYITPPDFHAAKRVALERLYVEPRIALVGNGSAHTEPNTVEQWRTRVDRAVIVGSPGAGKSTLLKRIAFGLASDGAGETLGGHAATPFLV